ncbi:hypothetical protein BREVNS_1537 [Brevinematales bacterium NS]|nr:ABC transporter permease [Brevinematales bacterium]QJR22287.1 hypothetical protein BREVNS_1537 [Brevinematales bacterium NS]
MIVFLKVALKNIFRSRVRSLLTILSLVIGVAALMMLNGYFKYSIWGLRESMIRGGIGHFQVYQKGFTETTDEGGYTKLIDGYKTTLRGLYDIEGVSMVAPRLRFQGILSTGDTSALVVGFGGWSEEELKLNSFGVLTDGSFISDEEQQGVVIASGLAKKLGAKVGDYLTLMTTTKGGGINAIDVHVKGIITLRIEEYNNTFMIVPLSLVQNLIGAPNSVDRLVLILQRTEDTARVEKQLKVFCEKNGFEYKSWTELATFYSQVKEMYESIFNVVLVIVLGVVIFAIANTMTMNIYERFREIGTIRAIGAKRKVVIQQFMVEGLLMSVIGTAVGIIVGLLLAGVINLLGGIYIPPPPGNSEGYYAFITPSLLEVFFYSLLFIIISLLATVFPAYKASRMHIIEALRTI